MKFSKATLLPNMLPLMFNYKYFY